MSYMMLYKQQRIPQTLHQITEGGSVNDPNNSSSQTEKLREMRMAADILKSKNFECESNITKSRDACKKKFDYEGTHENKYSEISQKNIDINNILNDSRELQQGNDFCYQ